MSYRVDFPYPIEFDSLTDSAKFTAHGLVFNYELRHELKTDKVELTIVKNNGEFFMKAFHREFRNNSIKLMEPDHNNVYFQLHGLGLYYVDFTERQKKGLRRLYKSEYSYEDFEVMDSL